MNAHRTLAAFLAAFLAAELPDTSSAQCDPVWSDAFAYLGAPRVYAIALFDPDGDGPRPPCLIVSGDFGSIGGVKALRIAAWDGSSWAPLGEGLDERAEAMIVFDEDGDGPLPPALYVGGWFTSAGGVPAGYIARWDGQEWTALDGGVDDTVFALAPFDPDGDGPLPARLAAGGRFTHAGGKSASAIALWDGAKWSRLGTGLHGKSLSVNAIAAYDDDGDGIPALVVGGQFSTAGGLPVTGIAKWDAGACSALGEPLLADPYEATVSALKVADTDGDGPLGVSLVIGGSFDGTADRELNNIARLESGSWKPLGEGLQSGGCFWNTASVDALEVFDPDGPGARPPRLIAAGAFCVAPPNRAHGAAQWDGQAWTPLAPDLEGENYAWKLDLLALPEGLGSQAHPLLAIGGDIAKTLCTTEGVALWDGSHLLRLGQGLATQYTIFQGAARAAAEFDPDGDGPQPPALAVVGGFVGHIALFDSGRSEWMGASVQGDDSFNGWCFPTEVRSVAAWDDDGPGPHLVSIYASGPFSSIADLSPDHHLVAWDAAAGWHEIGGSSSPVADALLALDIDGAGPEPGSLYAAGEFGFAGGVQANLIARWDGASWHPLGTGISGTAVYALAGFDPDGDGPLPAVLIAGGNFSFAGGQAASNVAAWDGTSWSALGEGLGDEVHGLCVWDREGDGHAPLLVAAQPSGEVAAWDGVAWSVLGSADGPVHAVAAFDDRRTGEVALFAAGMFTAMDGVSAANIARLDGGGWSPLGSGLQGVEYGQIQWKGVNALEVHDDDGAGPVPPALYVLGYFTGAGGHPSDLIARWGCAAPPPCAADCDGDGVLDLLDWTCFVGLFNAGDPGADCDGSGGLDLFDFLCFVNAFNGGC